MDKSAIQTKKITIGKDSDKREITVYAWLTQYEEDEYLSILTKGKDFTPDLEGNVSISTNAENISAARNYLVEHYCTDLKMDEFNVMRPDLRKELTDAIELLNAKKK